LHRTVSGAITALTTVFELMEHFVSPFLDLLRFV